MISYPFFSADRIQTPTLFMCGEKDFNVPLLNSEQVYQALRSLNVPTRLVIYPGQFHGLTRPSYVRDRIERMIDWYDTPFDLHGMAVMTKTAEERLDGGLVAAKVLRRAP